ncbi:centrosomal protein 43 isoform X2 [Macrotis lagotis]|uniref:centrosomal protein 43 isoform X2 n=1 Tax=Macrotis lagotis TaxID=92651 RepID=UPI003D6813C6
MPGILASGRDPERSCVASEEARKQLSGRSPCPGGPPGSPAGAQPGASPHELGRSQQQPEVASPRVVKNQPWDGSGSAINRNTAFTCSFTPWSLLLAELRAAVFLALEEQEKIENKTPLVNESLKKFLNTKDGSEIKCLPKVTQLGRLVASLVAEFLQFFNLDFTLAVFQPETSTIHGLDPRENLARDLGIIEAEGTVGGPLLLEVIRRCQQKEKGSLSGEGGLDLSDIHSPSKSPEGKITSSHTVPSKIPRYKGQGKKKKSGEKAGEKKTTETNQSDTSISSSEMRSKSLHLLANETKLGSSLNNRALDGKDKAGRCSHEDDLDGDSFFDDPVPKPEKNYGWKSESNKQGGSLASLSDAPPLKSGLNSLTGTRLLKESEHSRGSSVLRDLKMVSDKIGSLGLGAGDEEDYMDDFNSTISHRSEKSEISIGEEIEEDISVELDDININDKVCSGHENNRMNKKR